MNEHWKHGCPEVHYEHVITCNFDLRIFHLNW